MLLLDCLKLQLTLQGERHQRRRLGRHLKTMEQQWLALADRAAVGIALVSQERLVYCNPPFACLFGEHEPGKLDDKSLPALVNPTQRSALATTLKQARTGNSQIQITPTLATGAGSLQLEFSTASHQGQSCVLVQAKPAGKTVGTRQRQGQVGKDLITRLDNLPFFESRVESAITAAINESTDSMLLVTRIDRFRHLQETIGKAATLQVLSEIAGFLDTAINKAYAATRLAEDEFAVLLFDCPSGEAARLADFIDSRVNVSLLPSTANDFELEVSTGLAVINRHANDVNGIIGCARMNTGRGHGQRRAMKAVKEKDSDLLDSLTQALDNNSLALTFQPVLPFNPDELKRFVVSYHLAEAGDNALSPESLAACANVHNLGFDIDRQVLARLLAGHAPGKQPPEQGRRLQYRVPLNSNTLANDAFPAWLSAALHEHSFMPEQLAFLVSEIDLYSNRDQVSRCCSSLAGLGCQCLITDFGTAMDPLPLLSMLKPDGVHLDALLVRDLPFSHQQQETLGKLIPALHHHHVSVTVANLEDADLLPLVFELGADLVHGNCLGPRLNQPRFAFPREQVLQMTG